MIFYFKGINKYYFEKPACGQTGIHGAGAIHFPFQVLRLEKILLNI